MRNLKVIRRVSKEGKGKTEWIVIPQKKSSYKEKGRMPVIVEHGSNQKY
jgi:hypothetical protein